MGAERLIAAAVAILLALAAGCDDGAPQQDGSSGAGTGVVARVNDGDTLTLRDGAKVRLVQIDAPELTTDCYGREALAALDALAPKGTRVQLVRDPALDDRDTYGRLLRYVVVGGETDVNLELVRRGAAAPYFFRGDRGEHAQELLDAADDARKEHAGFWGACPGAKLNPGIGSITGKR